MTDTEITIDGHATRAIRPGIMVWHRYALPQTDNGEPGDRSITLWIAPEVGGDDDTQWLYLTTNGDPVIVASLNDAAITVHDDAVAWLEQDQYSWVREVLDELDPSLYA
jgi:hypothetical protein